MGGREALGQEPSVMLARYKECPLVQIKDRRKGSDSRTEEQGKQLELLTILRRVWGKGPLKKEDCVANEGTQCEDKTDRDQQ